MNLFLIFLWSLLPIKGDGLVKDTKPATSISVFYSFSGYLTTSLQKLLINQNGLEVSVGMNTVRLLKEHKTLSYSAISIRYEKNILPGFSFAINGYFNVPINSINGNNFRFFTKGAEQ